jgi:hypothetical protein
MNIIPSMLLVKSQFTDQQGQKRDTFKLIPLTLECPYVGGILNVYNKALHVSSVHKQDSYIDLPKLDDNGDPQKVTGKPRPQKYMGVPAKEFRETRKDIVEFVDFEIQDKQEILNFLKMVTINLDSFDIESYFLPITENPRDQTSFIQEADVKADVTV